MSAEYIRDPSGTVHVMAPFHGGELTWCDQPVVDFEDGDAFADGYEARCSGPATCPGCRAAATDSPRPSRGSGRRP